MSDLQCPDARTTLGVRLVGLVFLAPLMLIGVLYIVGVL